MNCKLCGQLMYLVDEYETIFRCQCGNYEMKND